MNKKSLKDQVLEFLRDLPKEKHEQYNIAYDLYRKSPEKDENQERVYNQGFSDMNLANLLYDLQKLNGISDLEKLTPVAVETEDLSGKVIEITADASTDENKSEFQANDYNAIGDLSGDGKESSEANQANDIDVKTDDDFKAAADSDERKKLRDEYPFLDEEDCPIELRALMTDTVTSYRKYCIAHNKLQAHRNGTAPIADESELNETIKAAVEDFEANRATYDELNYYKEKGKVLGVHPIFKSLTLQREVNSMNEKDLQLFVDGSKKFLATKKGQITKAGSDEAKLASINKSIDEHVQKLVLVQRKLEASLGE